MINVTREQPSPPSLAEQKTHRSQDVIDALWDDFRHKCYLTEKVFDSPKEMEIDHFQTQTERPELIHTWENLYPIDNKANKKRPKHTPSGGYLDPCNPADDVEQEIVYVVEFGGSALFKPRNPANLKAINSANLLNHVHRDLKAAVKDKHHELVNALMEWRHARELGDTPVEFEKELLLRKLLSRDSHYTMLMRSIKALQSLPADFLD